MSSKTLSFQLPSQGKSGINWLLIFLVLDDGELDTEIGELKQAMAPVQVNENIKIIFIKDTVQRIRGTKSPKKIEINEFKYKKETGRTEFIPFLALGVNVRRRDSWAKIIISLKKRFAANNSVFITWSHGSGISLRNASHRKEEFTGKQPSTELPCNKLEHLFLSELANELEDLRASKFDMFVMNNCYMQTLDCCYNLRHICRYYVSSETGMQESGYDFAKLVQMVNGPFNSAMDYGSYKKLITRLVDSFWERHKPPTVLAENSAVIASSLEFITGHWVAHTNRLIQHLVNNRAYIFPILRHITTNRMIDLGSGNFLFDAAGLFKTVSSLWGDNEFKLLLADFLSVIQQDRFIIYKRIGEELEENDNQPTGAKLLIECFSLYIPLPNRRIHEIFKCQYQLGKFRSEFVQQFKWAELLNEYIPWLAANPR